MAFGGREDRLHAMLGGDMMPGGMAKKEYVALSQGERVVWKLAMHVGEAFVKGSKWSF